MVYRIASAMALCLCSTFAFAAADIIVTTPIDRIAADGECSLREAVNYINADQRDAEGDCKPEDDEANAVITLDNTETYTLNSALLIKAGMTIQADNVFGVRDQPADEQPIIEANGRAFLIDDGSAFPQPSIVVLSGLRILGVAAESDVAVGFTAQEQGGLIFNRELLSLDRVTLSGGVAKEGGAIYNSSLDAFLDLSQVLFERNYADQGAAVYSESFGLNISQVSIVNNGQIDPAADGFSIYLETPFVPSYSAVPEANAEPVTTGLVDNVALLTNILFFDNRTGAAELNSSLSANNLTVINNDRGVKFNAAQPITNEGNRISIVSRIANSVLLGNKEYDLSATADDKIYLNHLVYDELSGDFDPSSTTRSESLNDLGLNDGQLEGLIASQTVEINGETVEICRIPLVPQPGTGVGSEIGLFCPLIRIEGEYLPTIKPRLFLTYESLDDSPIVNSGLRTGTESPIALDCEPQDIRGQARPICDIGSFELVVFGEGALNNSVNEEIVFGDLATLNLATAIGDGQLVPAEFCAGLMLPLAQTDQETLPTGNNMFEGFTDGCLRFVRGNAPQKGSVEVLANGLIQYTPGSNYQGTDTFQYRVVTTTSRFSGANNEKYLTVTTQILQDPKSGIDSDTIGIYGDGGGSNAPVWLFALTMLGLSRRIALKLR